MDNRLKELRGQKGWSQAALADQVGTSRQTINALENDRYDPSLPLAFRLSVALEEAIEDLFQPSAEDLGANMPVTSDSGQR